MKKLDSSFGRLGSEYFRLQCTTFKADQLEPKILLRLEPNLSNGGLRSEAPSTLISKDLYVAAFAGKIKWEFSLKIQIKL